MNPRIHVQGFELSAAIDNWTRSQLAKTLRRYGPEIVATDVYLKDVNGPKGGQDKLALVRVQLRGTADVIIETAHSDLYVAIDRSARRTRRAVRRTLDKRRNQQRREVPRNQVLAPGA